MSVCHFSRVALKPNELSLDAVSRTALETLGAATISIAGVLWPGSGRALAEPLHCRLAAWLPGVLARLYTGKWRLHEVRKEAAMRIPKTVIGPLLAWTIVVAPFSLFWFAGLRPGVQQQRLTTNIAESIDNLRHKRPSGFTRNEWAYIVGRTQNAQANCCSSFYQITDYEHFKRFAEELKHRVADDVDLQTVDWTWDEFVAFSSSGPSYSEQNRPTSRERIKEAGISSYDIEVD